MNQHTILRLRRLQVAYEKNGQKNQVLKNINFQLHRGEILALLGESGSGKSTLGKTITGLLSPSALIEDGSMCLGDAPAMPLQEVGAAWQQIRGTKIGMIFQDARLALNPLMTIKAHFKETLLFHHRVAPEQVEKESSALLQRLNFEDVPTVLEAYPFQLSGGMCQRICIALTLCIRPDIIVADEPTAALDMVSQKEVLDLLLHVKEQFDQSILFITHDIANAYAISDRIMILDQGQIIEEGSPQEIVSAPQQGYTKKLIADWMNVQAVHERDASSETTRKPVLKISGLEKRFSGHEKYAIKDIDFTLFKSEILGVVGQSGCGKSTLSKCIAGLETPDGGHVYYQGQDLFSLKTKERRKMCRHIQMIFQDARASLNPRYTALELTRDPLDYLQIGHRHERIEKAQYFLQKVGIDEAAQCCKPQQLSTGQCQRIAIARALVVEPELLICDEVVSALDVRIQSQILSVLEELHDQLKFSILMISHDLHVLRNFSTASL